MFPMAAGLQSDNPDAIASCSASNYESTDTVVSKTEGFTITEEGAAIFDSSWISANDDTLVESAISKSVNDGMPTLLFESESSFFEIGLTGIGVETGQDNAIVQGLYKNDGISFMYNVVSEDEDFAMEHGAMWAEAMNSDDPVDSIIRIFGLVSYTESVSASDDSEEPSGEKLVGVSTVTKDLKERGEFTATAIITKIVNTYDEAHDYFIIHYYQMGMPDTDNDYYLGDLCLEAKVVNGTLNLVLPKNTSGTQEKSVTIGLTAEISTGGPSIGGEGSGTWSYSIGDVVVQNKTSYAQKTAKVYHNVDENQNVGKGYTAEPGMLFTVDKGETVTVENDHSINTYLKDWSLLGYNKFVNGRYDHIDVSYVINSSSFEEVKG